MRVLEKYMPLKEGETVIESIEGNAYNLSANIILRILGGILRIFAVIFGHSRKIHLVVTQNRVITVETEKILWFIDLSANSRSYTPRSVSQVGYALKRSMIIFKSHYLEFISAGSAYLIKSESSQKDINVMINAITGLAEKTTQK